MSKPTVVAANHGAFESFMQRTRPAWKRPSRCKRHFRRITWVGIRLRFASKACANLLPHFQAGMAELADAADSKSAGA